MSLKYTCPGCGTPLGYDGLCWKCKCEQERKTALAWTPEQIAAKQKNRRWPQGCSGPVRSIITLPLMWGRA